MAMEDHLSDIKGVKGFMAVGVMQFTGELLAAEVADTSIDLGLVGATFNDIFRSVHEVCEKIGLERATQMALHTAKGVVVMRASEPGAKIQLHLVTILAADGNQALAKMYMEQAIPKLQAELS